MEANMDTPVLIAEDDPKTAQLLASYLDKEAIATVIAADGKLALKLFELHQPRLIILDIMLPRMNGLEVCTEIRKTSNVPIIFLTARDEEVDKLLGLGIGGDDYVVKPFSPREVVARVKAHLRRSRMSEQVPHATTAMSSPNIEHGPLKFEADKHRFLFNGEPLALTPLEFTILRTFMETPGRVFLRNELLDKLYPDGELVVDRVIDVHIGKLRQKIGDNPANPTYIHTVRGIGYRFADSTR